MQITGSYQGYTKQQNLAALQNFLKQQNQNTASTPNSQSGQSKKDSVEISQQGRQALRDLLLSKVGLSYEELRARGIITQSPIEQLQQSIEERSSPPELTPVQQKEQQLMRNIHFSTNSSFDDEFKNFIEYAMNKLGIDFQDMEEIEIGLTGSGREIKMTVSGLKNESDNQKLAEALNTIPPTTSLLTGGNPLKGGTVVLFHIQQMFYRNTDFAMSTDDEHERNRLAYLIGEKDAIDNFIKEKGINLDFSQLYRTEDGKIAGYPEEAAWYFETDNYAASVMCRYANEFLDAGYDNIPNVNELNVVFNFNKGSFVDLNASV